MRTIDNWRVNLAWPEQVTIADHDIEVLYEDENDKTESVFSKENALAALLLAEVIFLNSNWWEKGWPEEARKTVALCVNTNDVFAWGCADAEAITYDEIEGVYRYWVKDPAEGTAVWAMIRTKQMPQRPVEKALRDGGIWDVDALQKEHGLRANHYDGVSRVLARRKREVYEAWCAATGRAVMPFDGSWWTGWSEYAKEHPDWYDDAWKQKDARCVREWKLANGYEVAPTNETKAPPDVLRAAVLWARNHIDAGVLPELQEAIIGRLDRVLADHSPTVADIELLRERYP